MANSWIEPPPPQKGMGCFAKGCLTLVVFGLILVAACFAGYYWGLRHHSALMRGFYWLTRTHMLAESPTEVPRYQPAEGEMEAIKERWDVFENAVRQHESAEIELTANDLNALIERNRRLRGQVFISADGNRLRVQTSIPLQEYLHRKGYYLNADVTIQSDGLHSFDQPRLSAIVINGQSVPGDVLDWKYDSRPLQHYLTEFQEKNNVNSFEIRDGKVILRSSPN
jgi:hypothetical protein